MGCCDECHGTCGAKVDLPHSLKWQELWCSGDKQPLLEVVYKTGTSVRIGRGGSTLLIGA